MGPLREGLRLVTLGPAIPSFWGGQLSLCPGGASWESSNASVCVWGRVGSNETQESEADA